MRTRGEARGDGRHNSSEPVAVVGISVLAYSAGLDGGANKQEAKSDETNPWWRAITFDRHRCCEDREIERAYEISSIKRTRT